MLFSSHLITCPRSLCQFISSHPSHLVSCLLSSSQTFSILLRSSELISAFCHIFWTVLVIHIGFLLLPHFILFFSLQLISTLVICFFLFCISALLVVHLVCSLCYSTFLFRLHHLCCSLLFSGPFWRWIIQCLKIWLWRIQCLKIWHQ